MYSYKMYMKYMYMNKCIQYSVASDSEG